MFAVDDKKSFENVKTWVQEIDRYAGEGVVRLLVGNKCDLEERDVNTEEAKVRRPIELRCPPVPCFPPSASALGAPLPLPLCCFPCCFHRRPCSLVLPHSCACVPCHACTCVTAAPLAAAHRDCAAPTAFPSVESL